MMIYNQSKRKYTMSDVDMWWAIYRMSNYLKQDIEVLSAYGIDENKVDYLISLCKSIEAYPPDAQYKYTLYEMTEALDLAISDLKEAIRIVIVQSKACFGDKSAFVKNLELANYSKFPFEKLISASKSAIPLLESNLESLKEVGLTTERIQDLLDKIKAAEEAKLTQKKHKEDRINGTKDRINLFNEIFEQVMIYANIANAVLAKSNPRRAKYYTLSYHRKLKREGEAEAMGNGEVS